MTEPLEDYTGKLPEGWSGGQHLTKWWRGNIVHLYTLRRPCAECGAEMRIDVSKAALEGRAKNAGLHLKRCKTCRDRTKAVGSSSRPRVAGEVFRSEVAGAPWIAEPAAGHSNANELLRTANATMKAELEGLYAENAELRERLARYELAPAMEAIANGAGAKPEGGKLPWE